MDEHSGPQLTVPRPTPRPVTAPWCGRTDTLFSWQVGSCCGISGDQRTAMRHVSEELIVRGGQGIVQQCARRSTYADDDPDQYEYGNVVARATIDRTGRVIWRTS